MAITTRRIYRVVMFHGGDEDSKSLWVGSIPAPFARAVLFIASTRDVYDRKSLINSSSNGGIG